MLASSSVIRGGHLPSLSRMVTLAVSRPVTKEAGGATLPDTINVSVPSTRGSSRMSIVVVMILPLFVPWSKVTISRIRLKSEPSVATRTQMHNDILPYSLAPPSTHTHTEHKCTYYACKVKVNVLSYSLAPTATSTHMHTHTHTHTHTHAHTLALFPGSPLCARAENFFCPRAQGGGGAWERGYTHTHAHTHMHTHAHTHTHTHTHTYTFPHTRHNS